MTCDPKLSGGGFECETDSPGLALPGAVPSPLGFFVVKLFIGAKFDVTPEGAVVTRGLSIGGNSVAGPDDLSLTDSMQSETLSVPCRSKAGDAVQYGLDPYHWTPASTATEQVKFKLVEALDPFGFTELFKIVDGGVGSAIVTNPNFDLSGAGFNTPMGSLLANNIKPTIAPLGTFSGQEGSAISFVLERQLAVPDRLVRVGVLERHEVLRAEPAAHVRRQRRLRRPADRRPTSPDCRRRRASRSTSRT